MRSYLKFIVPVLAFAACDSSDEPVKIEPQTRLQSITTSMQRQDGTFRPSEKKIFSYSDAGKVVKEEYFIYDVTESRYDLFSTSTFDYADNKLRTITKIAGVQQTVTSYTYNAGILVKMNQDDEIDTEATIQYEADTIQVLYTKSNGRFFTYRFSTNNDNIDFERTIDDSQQVGSIIVNEFDSGKNPHSLLGFTDIFFTNYSKNNKVRSTGEYFTHQPQSVPSVYEYEYNSDHLPSTQTITYKSYPTGDVTGKLQHVFEYSTN
jgi:hypothetical protein